MSRVANVQPLHFAAGGDDARGEGEGTVVFERASVDDDGAGGEAGGGGAVDEDVGDGEVGEVVGEEEAGGAGAGDEDGEGRGGWGGRGGGGCSHGGMKMRRRWFRFAGEIQARCDSRDINLARVERCRGSKQ